MRTAAENSGCTCALLTMVALGSLFPFAASAEWQVMPGSTLTSGYTGNPRLLPEGGEDEFVSVAELDALIIGGTERLKFSLAPRATFSSYETEESLDSNNQFLTATSSLQNERTAWTGSAQIAHDSTQISELGTTGLVQDNRRREFMSLGAGPSWMATETLTTGANVQWSDVHYIDAGGTGLVDYTRSIANLYGSFDLSERTRLTMSAQRGWLDVPTRPYVTRDTGLTLGMTRQMGPRWQAELAGGPSLADSGVSTERGYLFSTSLVRQGEDFQFSFRASRDLNGAGNGVLTQVDALTLSATRNLSERLSVALAGQFTRNKALFGESGPNVQDIHYYGIDGSLNWRVARDWKLVLSLAELSQKSQTSAASSADSYRVSLGLAWNGKTLTP